MRIAVLDIGGTTLKSGIFQNGMLTEKKETPINTQLGGAHVMEEAKKITASYSNFHSIGISTAGVVDSDQGIIRFANQNIPNYTGVNVKEIFNKAFNVPVIVENDVNAAAMGEIVFGNGQKAKDNNFLCLTYGTGVGGAIVFDGKLYKGFSFSAGEFGYMITHADDPEPGNYEKYSSTKTLVNNVKTVMPELDDGIKIIANMNHPKVKEIVDNWIKEVIYGLVGLIHIFNPSLVILGGGIMKQPYVIESIKKNIVKYLMPGFADVMITSAALGNDAGLWGVGYLAGASHPQESQDNYTKLSL